MSDLLNLSIAATIEALSASIRAGSTPVVFGPPGIGKTSILTQVAKAVELELQVIVGGTLSDRDDIAGTPFVANGALQWCHRAQIKAAIERPCLLVVDEYLTTPEQTGGPLLNLLLGRRAGDTPLHPQSRVMALANEPRHAPSARRMSPAEANRLGFFTMQPTVQEVAKWFAERPEPTLSEFGLLLPHRTEFLQIEPPDAKVEAGKTWGSPRAWENGLRAFGHTGIGFSDDKTHRVGFATLAAYVGADLAGGYLALRSQRKRLPAFDAILDDPKASAKGLDRKSVDVMLAALGAVPSIASQDTGAAWIWVNELPARYVGAACSALVNTPWVDGKHTKDGRKVSMKALADLATNGTGF
jgi:hypothetical protein